MKIVGKLDFKKQRGLVPAIIQDFETGEILMLGYMNSKAFSLTMDGEFVYFWSRSKNRLWMKGEESGDKLLIKEIFVDCDFDTVLVKVKMLGKCVCHTGKRSCFFKKVR